jgi:hypothetical protein
MCMAWSRVPAPGLVRASSVGEPTDQAVLVGSVVIHQTPRARRRSCVTVFRAGAGVGHLSDPQRPSDTALPVLARYPAGPMVLIL